MKKKLLAVVLALAMMFALVGCGEKTENGNKIERVANNITLVRVVTGKDFRIYVHTETRVMYIAYDTPYSMGLSVMLDADGKPLLWEGEL